MAIMQTEFLHLRGKHLLNITRNKKAFRRILADRLENVFTVCARRAAHVQILMFYEHVVRYTFTA